MKKRVVAAVSGATLVLGLGLGTMNTASATVDPDNYVVYSSAILAESGGGIANDSINCDSGDTAMGGGFAINGAEGDAVKVTASAPVRSGGSHTSAIGWYATMENNDPTNDHYLYIHVVCQDT